MSDKNQNYVRQKSFNDRFMSDKNQKMELCQTKFGAKM